MNTKKTKAEISKALNRELAHTLDRYETIFNYYEENPERLNIYDEKLSRKEVRKQGNVPYVLALCDDYFKINETFKNKYGIELGRYHSNYENDEDGNSKGIVFRLMDSNGLNVESDLIKKMSFFNGEMRSLQERNRKIEAEFNKRRKK